jgi:hypothetical protein
MEQGGIGLLLTFLILSVPPMAANFFNGALGQFSPFVGVAGGNQMSRTQQERLLEQRQQEKQMQQTFGTGQGSAPNPGAATGPSGAAMGNRLPTTTLPGQRGAEPNS